MTPGYIFTHEGKQFDPDGTVNVPDPAEHNRQLDAETVRQAIETGRAILYLTNCQTVHRNYTGVGVCHSGDPGTVGTWAGGWSVKALYAKKSWHNFAGKNGRTDVWFTGPDGKQWRGVNIGDNQILRCHRLKRQ